MGIGIAKIVKGRDGLEDALDSFLAKRRCSRFYLGKASFRPSAISHF
jgi:hypothetical protein